MVRRVANKLYKQTNRSRTGELGLAKKSFGKGKVELGTMSLKMLFAPIREDKTDHGALPGAGGEIFSLSNLTLR